MANEISYTITVTYSNPNYNITQFTFTSGADAISIQGEPGPYQRGTFTTSTSQTAIPSAAIGTLGAAVLRNCDSTNTIFVFATASGGSALLQLNPGEVQFVRFATTAVPSVKSSAGTPILEYLLIGN
jgi:hypothetical protein